MNLRKFYSGRAVGFLVVLVLLFLASLFYKKDETVTKLCFIRNTEDGGSANLSLNITGKKVTGYFKWAPAEKDLKEGALFGKISDPDVDLSSGTIKLIWNASGEGVTNSEELKLRFSAGVVAPGFGEMKEDGGVYVYANPDKIVFEPNLSSVDCGLE